MARPESVAVGGYFPTPGHLLPLIAHHLTPGEGGGKHFVDPCAGDGAAIFNLQAALGGFGDIYACEMEAQRYEGLKTRARKDGYNAAARTLHGDAFRVELSAGAGLLLLNPPYDLDPVHGRLEQRFLERFAEVLCNRGVLIFIVPHYALSASADLLATTFDNVQCYRFPKTDFAVFKQVVVFASKVARRLSPDSLIATRVKGWAKSVAKCPLLGTAESFHEIPGNYTSPTWHLREFDLRGLMAKARPWRYSRSKGGAGNLAVVPHIMPEVPVEDLLFRTYSVATAPRPAHIAAGIASGLFNGREVSSATPGMPNLLVKGVFTREFVTIQENFNSDGDKVSVTQVQQPRLETTVLDLTTKRYSLLKPAGAPKTDQIDGMGIEGLLEHYGPSLMDVMAEQCPVLYDPKRDAASLPLAPVGRPLFRAHENAAKALYMLLGGPGLTPAQRRGQAAILLGEIGSGKTATGLAVGQTIARKILVLCPPHLLDSWENETNIVIPGVEVRILDDISDVDALAAEDTGDRVVVAVLSREDAKLSHGVEAVEYLGCCPKCGAPLPAGDLAKKRAHCDAQPLKLADELARAAFGLALHVAPQAPADGNVRALLEGRHLGRYLASLDGGPKKRKSTWASFDSYWVARTTDVVARRLLESFDERLAELLGELLMADYEPTRVAEIARMFIGSVDWRHEGLSRALTCLLPLGSELQNEIQKEAYKRSGYYGSFETDIKRLQEPEGLKTHLGVITRKKAMTQVNDLLPGSVALALSILSRLAVTGSYPRAEKACGEPLYQANARPRRYPVAKYIARRHPKLFDFLMLDEGHEYQNGDTAQSHAAHRLTALGIPFVLLTGSLMNGYAESLFTNMWAISPDFRAEFRRDEKQKYNERYGYSKRILTDKDRETRKVVSFGTQSDRVERATKMAGKAPGLLPLFLFRHLLRYAVTLHKADLALDLPKCHHIRQEIEPSPKQRKNYDRLVRALKSQISKDRFSTDGLAGKLFGALAELPSYLDRATADVGNNGGGSYAIRYPESVGGTLVAEAEPISAKTILPKEQWLIDTVRAEVAEGRRVLVFCWHTNLVPRIARLLKAALGTHVPILDADRVPPRKRESWLNENVVAAGADAMVVNPVGIQTGLNNLVYFNTEIWMEDPANNPTTFRQGVGRVDRVGARKETRIYTPVYAGTLQVQLHELLLRKVAVATAADGLDNESMLIAAGAAEDAMLTGLSIGRQLWDMMMDAN